MIVDVKSLETRVLGKGTLPNWTPDGKSIVYQQKNEYWLSSLDGKESKRLVRSAFGRDLLWIPLEYSAKGNYAAYLRVWSSLSLAEGAEVVIVRTTDLAQISVFKASAGSYKQFPVNWAILRVLKEP